jgi:anti-sigma regulatory factor (Ser/Thr protein kinase)
VCRRATLDLLPERASSALARSWVEAVCAEWELVELGDDLALATSEVVTNAVLHARTPIALELCVAESVVEMQVRDLSPLLPSVLPIREDLAADIDDLLAVFDGHEDDDLRHPSWSVGAAGSIAAGRGLHLLEAVTDCWGISLLPDMAGKVVWFTLAAPPHWRRAGACACATSSDRTASGRSVDAGAGPWVC